MATNKIIEAKTMTTAIAIFVKTPSLSPVKTRLAASIGEEKAAEFYKLSLKAIQKTIGEVKITPYWAVGEKQGLSDPLWSEFPALYTGEGGLGERQHHIYQTLSEKYNNVLLIGADAPQLSALMIEKSIAALKDHNFVVGPAHDGGYYLFGGRTTIDENIWTETTYSITTTRDDLTAKLPSKPFLLPPLTDVDTQNDLISMLNEIPKNMSVEQKNIVEWVTSLSEGTNKNVTTIIK